VCPAERWDGDARRAGVGAARSAAAALQELLELSGRPDWVAEQPELHLEPHVREAADRVGLRISRTWTTADGVFEVHLVHAPGMSRRAVRKAVWVVIGAVAEATTHVREVVASDGSDFHVVTGMPAVPGRFATHGHYLVLRARAAS
jgi:hypothetical protein